MVLDLPMRLISQVNGQFEVFSTSDRRVDHFDIITYTWGKTIAPYDCGIDGVTWKVPIRPKKLDDIKKLMITANIQYLWADCVCINQEDDSQKVIEIPKMYQYYKSARKCYVLMEMDEIWQPQEIVDNLSDVGHVIAYMEGSAVTREAKLGENLLARLSMWAEAEWDFLIDKSVVRSAAIDPGLLNCYSTCISRVTALFDNEYFTRVWTFQEMLLGKNITMYGIHNKTLSIYPLGDLDTWMDLATDCNDKAIKLQDWIENSRELKPASVTAILNQIYEDSIALDQLQTQVKGVKSARTDIINGGPSWWYENHKGVCNIFSAISITPRKCFKKFDIFRGLLGIFSGLFTAEEVERDLSGEDIDKLSFAFFKQLSLKTELAWTKLAISGEERGVYDWIPVIPKDSKLVSTDIYAAVVNLGRLNKKGQAKPNATTSLLGTPRKYMKITISEEKRGFQFQFKGCNCGKSVKTGMFKSELIPTHDQPRDISGDETGRTLVQCATVLGSLIDPSYNVVEYRQRLLRKLKPIWNKTDPNAKPKGWIDRCVSGTDWEDPYAVDFRVHNMSMNYRMGEMIGCLSRLENESTEDISCELRVNCGCTIIAPFSFIFEAITAVAGGSLGDRKAIALEDDRIILRDGLGLVQVGDVGRAFSLVAFGGDIDAHKAFAKLCRTTKQFKGVVPKLPWPKGRGLVREEFTHGIGDAMRDYGYIETGGSGNLLICRNNLVGQYKIVGVCIDSKIENKNNKGSHIVTIR